MFRISRKAWMPEFILNAHPKLGEENLLIIKWWKTYLDFSHG